MPICGHQWKAPRVPTAGAAKALWRDNDRIVSNETFAYEQCCLPRGHEGDHRSLANVTCAKRTP